MLTASQEEEKGCFSDDVEGKRKKSDFFEFGKLHVGLHLHVCTCVLHILCHHK